MMGRTHASMGALVGLALTPLYAPDVRAMWRSAALCTAMAIAPDFDMPQSRIGQMWGPVSSGVRIKVWTSAQPCPPLSWSSRPGLSSRSST
ncbi:metal-dependent hydrolase [Actinopolymorpha pittospori]